MALVKSLFTSEELTARIVTKMETILRREIEIDGIGLTFFFWGAGVKVDGVRIANIGEFGSEPLAGLEEFLLKVKLFPLLKRRLEITKIVLVKPDINIAIAESGRSNIEDILVFREDGALVIPVAVSLPLLEIQDGRIRYTNRKSQVTVVGEHIDHFMSFDTDRTFQHMVSGGKTTIGSIMLSDPELSKGPLQGMSANIEYRATFNAADDKVEIESIRIELPFLAVTLKGEIINVKTVPAFTIAVNSDQISLEKVLKSLPLDVHPLMKAMDISGWTQLSAYISGDVTIPRISGKFLVRNVQIKHTDIFQPVGITTDIDFTENTLDVRNFQAAVGGNHIKLNVNLKDFKDPILNARAQSNFNLEEIGRLYPLPPWMAVSGEISSELSAWGKISTPEALRADGQVSVMKAAVSLPHVEKPLENVQGKITFSQNSVEDLKMSLSWGRSDLSLSGQVTDLRTLLLDSGKKPRVTLLIASNILDVDEILPPPEKKGMGNQDKADQPPVLPIPDVEANIQFQGKSLRWQTMDMANVSLKLRLQERMATLEECKANVYGGILSLNGYVDLSDEETPAFSIKTRIDNVEANTFLSRFSSLGRHLFGKIIMGITLEGKGRDAEAIKRSLSGSGGLVINEGRLQNWTLLQSLARWTNLPSLEEIRFKDWQGSFFVLNQGVKTDDLRIHGENADWSVSGSMGFDGSLDYKVDALLSPSLSQKVGSGSLGNLTTLFEDEPGRVSLMFRVSGKPSKPKFEWDTKSAQEKAGQRLASEAEKLKQETERKLQAEKTRLGEEAKKKADELKKKAEEEKKKKEEELKKKAQEALKKILKPKP